MKKVKTRFLLVMIVGFLAGPTALASENKWNEVPVEARNCGAQQDKNYYETSDLNSAPAAGSSSSSASSIR
ncbi:MAG: hypothetical protein H7222_06480 [Methylotenera sp.]|nr:hypothetical protein [Oligoflexia bacterium]